MMPPPSNPFVSIVIPVRNERRQLPALLQSIADLDWPQNRRELILVDNGSSDGSYALLKETEQASIKVVQELHPGSYAARNAGVAIARGDILAFIDADCRPAKDWLREGIGFMRCGNLDLVAGNVHQTISSRHSLFDIVDRSIYLRQEWYAQQGFGATANLIVTAAAFQLAGGFDIRMQSSGDRLFCERALTRGLHLGYCDKAVVEHPTRSSLRAMARKEFRLGFGFGQIARLHPKSKGYQLFVETFLPLKGIRGCLTKTPSDVSWPKLLLALACYGLIRIPFRTCGFLRAWMHTPPHAAP